ncbi:hypothetical protein A3C23_00905 [Candidatus Roizmanbacteria bacterium RIFCSPHIGHO2_02_FULL_37_13b]|uniref:SIMPL domain-containing protein n=1 Tax=Candidatus Roizmanbacteria bacterium RIFCSPLOWO2_02_FULL_36_11 TaxID=1802071 RepID=A0A1F7JIZ0_9BACT|nr:MAG: hypothetical protein A3C23_00905 [Candidatus Roizmanbacteria bacterium RIFCSPHIGHO2_02_FULL_37_13b]OGK55546.1 MAG: hypothetical protein A3H78_05280 [Candidatus Roizmanbacteria bacterium RIFCSPLOWO2_02_FULL_36_11]
MENKHYDLKPILTYLTIIIISLIALQLIKSLDISYPITITTTTKSSELAVVGEGKLDIVPDIAYVDAGITVNAADSVQIAKDTINSTNNKIVESLKNLGIRKEDIKTSNYSIYPDYSYDNNVNKIRGYTGNATVSITVRDINQVPQVIEKATQAGANQVNGARFSIEKPENYREKVRDMAITNAKEQALKLAKNLGIRLGRITNIVESSPDNTYMPYAMKSLPMGGGGGGPAEMEPGTQTVTSTVTLYFEKK